MNKHETIEEQLEREQQETNALQAEVIRLETQIETDRNARYMTVEEKEQLGVGRSDLKFSSPIAYPRRW